MAIRLGVSQQTYQVLESAPERVSVERLFKVFAILRVKLTLLESSKHKSANLSKTKERMFSRPKIDKDTIMSRESRAEQW